jgi:hypothetical protein
LEEAQNAIDHLLDTFLSTLMPDSKAIVTFSAKSPIHIGYSVLPEHIAIVTNAIRSSLEIDFDCNDASLISAFSTPPKTNNQLHTNSTATRKPMQLLSAPTLPKPPSQ